MRVVQRGCKTLLTASKSTNLERTAQPCSTEDPVPGIQPPSLTGYWDWLLGTGY